MNKKFISLALVCVVSLSLLVVSVSAVQLRPMNLINHPGLTNPYHSGDASNMFDRFWSELCEPAHYGDIWAMNQGFNIPRFFLCGSGGD